MVTIYVFIIFICVINCVYITYYNKENQLSLLTFRCFIVELAMAAGSSTCGICIK
jgi:hypothetical protein